MVKTSISDNTYLKKKIPEESYSFLFFLLIRLSKYPSCNILTFQLKIPNSSNPEYQ